MNIKEYYTVMSRIYLNQVILVGFFLVVCFFIFSAAQFLFVYKLIFFAIAILLIYFFAKYVYYINREGSVTSVSSDRRKNFVQSNEQMMMFFPAPSLFVKFLNSDGICDFQLSDKNMKPWKWFLPFNRNKNNLQTYLFKKRDGSILTSMNVSHYHGRIEIITSNHQQIKVKLINRKRKLLQFKVCNDQIIIQITTEKIEVTKNDKRIATIQKGWMPIKWQKLFSPNTPILTFQEELNDHERYIIYGLVIFLFANHYN